MPQSKPRKNKAQRKKKRQLQSGRQEAFVRPETKEPPLKVKEPPAKKELEVEDVSSTLSELKKIGLIAGTLIFTLIVAYLVL